MSAYSKIHLLGFQGFSPNCMNYLEGKEERKNKRDVFLFGDVQMLRI